MALRAKVVISLCVFDTGISKTFVFVSKMQQKICFFLASRWVAGAEIRTGIKNQMAIRAVAGRGKKAAGLTKTQCFHRVFIRLGAKGVISWCVFDPDIQK